MILSLLIFAPLAGSILVYLAGFISEKASKTIAVCISALTVVLVLFIFLTFNWSIAGFQFVENYEWARSFGLSYSVGVDGISIPLLIIASFLTTLSAVGSIEQIKTKVKEYNALLLLFEGAVIGVFTSLNLIAFYVFWELVLIPMFFFIGVWGGPRKKYAAMKFLIFTFFGGVVILLGFLGIYFFANVPSPTFNVPELYGKIPVMIQLFVSITTLIGFGIKLAIFPLHTWLPDAHVEAPAPISVLLAGLLLKMGG
jgi:NADH-quinone oxidoreductase subunit M